MKIEKLVLGSYQTNCYVISHNDKAIVIDPGANGEIVKNLLDAQHFDLEAIFLTHGHFDHIGGVDYLYNQFHCKVYAHARDGALFMDSDDIAAKSMQDIRLEAPVTLFDGDFNVFTIFNEIILDAVHTPGHSEGSVVYVLRDYGRIFSGDTLFKEGIGRIDFPTSDKKAMKESLKLLKTFKDSCKVFPGHGDETTIGYEKENNFYF